MRHLLLFLLLFVLTTLFHIYDKKPGESRTFLTGWDLAYAKSFFDIRERILYLIVIFYYNQSEELLLTERLRFLDIKTDCSACFGTVCFSITFIYASARLFSFWRVSAPKELQQTLLHSRYILLCKAAGAK